MRNALTRRQILLTTAAALAASACGPAAPPPPPPPIAGPSKKILVIGAGLTGLTIAFDLVARGFDPIVLEASDRPGGRILTIRAPFPDGLYVEAGATHVLPDPDLLKLMNDVGAEVAPRKPGPKGLSQAVLRGGKRIVVPPGEEPPEEYELSPEEKALEGPFATMKKYFAALKDIDITKPLPASLLPNDALSAADFLKRQGASPGFQAHIQGAFAPDAPLDQVSALSIMREVGNFLREVGLPGPGGRVAGGSDRLPTLLAARLGDRILYGAHVRRIEQTATGVRVSFTRRGQLESMEGDRAALTLPSTMLRELDFAPALPEGKQRALKELTLVSVTRVWVGSRDRFWFARSESPRVESDEPLGGVDDVTSLQENKGAVLGLYVVGAEARRLAALSETDRIQTALTYCDRAIPGLRERFTVGASKCWDEDPLQRGAYARFAPGQMTSLLPDLMRAESRLHFGGDQTSYRPGFMHGAVSSARRVVDEIVRATGA